MGDFIICSGRRAEQPYLMKYENRAIYRMEELCWYMKEHLFLIDEHLITVELFDWIGEELGLKQLQRDLADCLRIRKSTVACALLIFEEAALYTEAELEEMEKKMEFYAGLQDAQRQKLLADHLLEVGLDRKALYLYLDLYSKAKAKKLSAVLLSSICYNAGRIYAGQFYLREAARMFAESFKAGRGDGALAGWLIVLEAMPEEERQELLQEYGDIPDPGDSQRQRAEEEIARERERILSAGRQRAISEAWRSKNKRTALKQDWLDEYIHSVTFH